MNPKREPRTATTLQFFAPDVLMYVRGRASSAEVGVTQRGIPLALTVHFVFAGHQVTPHGSSTQPMPATHSCPIGQSALAHGSAPHTPSRQINAPAHSVPAQILDSHKPTSLQLSPLSQSTSSHCF
jgi:hypothetical protein